ncbi:hypothetical protein B296_00050539 [Ensete ventricosum]|uniref:Uncharacterized protein n=1 Tax=Ensete ventricosum TaxID=4639 RepID=A0A426YKZ2_ENSVE|nr:hypothetical protein B296_00050539 [Ensete ventricosum]
MVCCFSLYHPVHAVCTDPSVDRYADHLLSCNTLDVVPYRMLRDCFDTITAQNRLVTVDFDRCRPLSSGISLAAARKREKKQGRRKRKRENLGTTLRMRRTSRGDDFFVVVFSSSPSPRLRR